MKNEIIWWFSTLFYRFSSTHRHKWSVIPAAPGWKLLTPYGGAEQPQNMKLFEQPIIGWAVKVSRFWIKRDMEEATFDAEPVVARCDMVVTRYGVESPDGKIHASSAPVFHSRDELLAHFRMEKENEIRLAHFRDKIASQDDRS